MSTAAEPRGASLPLPGGREGATVRVHPLLTGTVEGAKSWFEREPGRLAGLRALGIGAEMVEVPVPAFLVEHPGAGPFLIDTGLHGSVAVDIRQNFGRIASLAFKNPQMTASQAAVAQLRERGITPADVGVVLMTHMHVDHASAIADFPSSTFVMSAREWRAATEEGVLSGYVKRQFDHAFDYRTIDFDAPEVGSIATFGRAVDIFGDGSVVMAYTPGHTHGHCSVALRLRDRDLLVLGDAAYTERTFAGDALPHKMADEHRFKRSLRELQLYVRESPGTVVVPGHDLAAWRRLESSYE
ncbi:MAG TPA: N-acyl homoserine lactonase family protein [Thermoleophilaceae bacterium]|nr:N-acyl homoserine lactonase family protein [Thermoleophilaceae bacterium]